MWEGIVILLDSFFLPIGVSTVESNVNYTEKFLAEFVLMEMNWQYSGSELGMATAEAESSMAGGRWSVCHP